MLLQALILSVFSLSSATAQTDGDCGAPEGAHALLSETAGRLMLIGEGHGNEQSPAFVRSLVCLSLQNGESVTLALEISHTEQPGLDEFLGSDGSEEAVDALLTGSRFWDGTYRDGRSSHAMLELIEYMREARENGAEVTLLAADYHPEADPDLEQTPFVRDVAMARRLDDVAGQADRTLFLGGDFHTRRGPVEFHGQTLESIGSYIQGTEFVSVLAQTGFGESWGCRFDDDEGQVCGLHEGGADFFTGSPRVLSDDEFEQSPYAEFYRDGYDHLVFLGPSTASLPVVPLAD